MADALSQRRYTIQVVFILAGLLLLLKAGHLQLVDSDFRRQANAVAIEKYTQYPARGLVYDRNGELLIYNKPMYDLLVTYNRVDPEMDTTLFCELLGISKDYFERALNKNWSDVRYSKSLPFVFMSKIPAPTFVRFQEHLYRFPGFQLQLRNARDYPEPIAAHMLGYIREVNRNEIKKDPDVYALGDYIGASGLELAYEEQLRGTKGYRYLLKDNVGRDVGVFKNGKQDIDAEAGLDLVASLDARLQAYAEELMQNKIGSVVAIEPSTGEILTMVTTPSYNPQELTINNDNRGAIFQRLAEDPTQPLFNRSIMAQYPPGSLFKPFVALIAMQEGVLDPDRTLACRGAWYYNGKPYLGCHSHPTCRNVSDAIQYSCNNYFVTVFRDVVDQYGYRSIATGLDTFNAYLDRFGMGHKLGVDFPGEKAGNYPTSDFFENTVYKGENWNSIWLRSLGIGQGELLTTNMQLANMAAIVANRGYYYTPHLVKGYRYGTEAIDEKYRIRHDVGIDAEHFEPVVKGMAGAVTMGTAKRAYISDIEVCGKTGTAENPHGKDHSIFFCFAPRENPKIALAVYVENAGFGGSYAAPIASLLIEKYMKDEIRSPQRQWMEKYIKDAVLIEVDAP